MPLFSFNSIRIKVLFIQIATIILSVSMCGFFFVFGYFRYLEKTERKEAEALSKSMVESLKATLDFSEADYKMYAKDVEIIINILKHNPKVNTAVVYTAGGALWAIYPNDKDNTELPFSDIQLDSDSIFIKQTNNNWVLHHKIVKITAPNDTPNKQERKTLGYLSMSIRSDKTSLTSHTFYTSAYVLMLSILLAVIFWQFANNYIQKPINKLITFIKKIEHNKDYSARLLPEKDIELNDLVSVFNEMLVEVQKRDESLLAMQDELEHRVQERTQQLSEKTYSLEVSNRELEQFAYVTSHDLQEPLRMIASFSQLVGKKYQDSIDPETREYIFYITDGVKRMQTLIKDLLVYSRVGSVKMQIKLVNIENLLIKVLSNLRIAIQENRAQIYYNTQQLPIIEADETQTMQLFQNLINNGIKFQQKGQQPTITIEVADKEDHWLFSIKDNGIGIEAQYQERVFMIFQRLDRNYEGTGIGLAICKKVVERHKGNIWFESVPNEGTSFYFTYPKKVNTEFID